MRRARLFDGIGPSGEPYFAPDRARIADPTERARVLEFLRSGTVIRGVLGFDVDRMDRSRGSTVPRSTVTDGVWIWNVGLAYYVETYGISPEPDFLRHMADSGYQAPTPERQVVLEAAEYLRASQRSR